MERDVEVGHGGDPHKEVVTYRVRGFPGNRDVFIANMRIMGMAGQWRVRRDAAREYEPHDYETAEAALAALQAEVDRATG